MGRDITGIRVEHNRSPYAKVKPTVSADSNRVANHESPERNNELKDYEVKECTSEVPRAETSREKQETLAVKSTNLETEKPHMKFSKAEDQKLSSPDKTTSGTPSSGSSKMKETQKPIDVAVDMQTWGSPRVVETNLSPTPSNLKTPDTTRRTQPTTPFLARRPSDDDDNWSMASSAQTTRSRITVAVAPSFSCSDRMAKRKEYYAKLEEKRKALEAEKREYEARTKEDEDKAIKQLRKNMVFRANPVPNFYYEKPPPKKELKKLPTTRAVSPKLGRRKSCTDAVCTSSSKDKVCGQTLRRSSLGTLREVPTQTSNSKKKDPLANKDRLKLVKETTKRNTPPKVTKQTNPDIAVQT